MLFRFIFRIGNINHLVVIKKLRNIPLALIESLAEILGTIMTYDNSVLEN